MSVFWFVLTFAIVEGLLAGSFLNVCIRRLPAGRSIVQPRSHCMACGHTVRWFDNVPVVSYLVLRGRCSDCSANISALYPVVEIVVAVWFAFAALPFATAFASAENAERLLFVLVHAVSMSVFGFLLIGLFFTDWQSWKLPNEFTMGGICLGLFFAGAESFWVSSVPYKTFFTPEEVFFGKRLAAAVAGYALLWVIGAMYRVIRGRSGMGGGDAKLLAMIGAFLGMEQLAVAFLAAIAACTLFAVWLLATRKANGRTPVPFGSFLSLGGLTAAVAGERILNWYLGLFH